MNRTHVRLSLLLPLLAAAPALAIDDHLVLCEAVLTPTASEYLEIANPTGGDIALDNYYLSDDEDYALLPGFFGAGPAPSIGSSDFIARFPAGAMIPAGGVLTVAFDGAGFATAFGSAADFEIAGTDAGTPDMVEAFTGSIGATRGLTNSGENAVIFFWDGASDLVADGDMTNLGTPSSGNDIGDKTGVSVDGPDGDTDASTYLTDLFTMPLQGSDPGTGVSTKRITLEGANETTGGGNGLTGDDETSEQITTTWDSTFTAPDPGTCAALSPAEPMLVINEIDYDQDGTDAAEFIEIKNTGATSVDLDAYEVVLVNGSNDTIYLTIDLPAASLPPGEYYVICGDAANVPDCDLDVSPDTNLIQNGAPDAVALRLAGDIIDTVSYEGDVTGFTEGSGAGLEDDPGVDLAGISRFPDGADTDMNNVDLSLRCATPGAENVAESTDCVPPAVPELVINEIDYDQDGTDTAEFIEIKNVGAAAVNLDPFTVELVNGGTGTSYLTIDLPDTELAAGGYFVICADSANTLFCDLDVSPDTNLIQNGAPDAVALMLGAGIVDTVSYEGDTAGFTEGSGAGLEDDPSVDFSGISRFPDGADTDMNNVDLSPRCITPGLANSADSSSCVPPAPPELVINEIDYDQSGTDAAEFIELKNVGAGAADLSGVAVELVNGNGGAVYGTFPLPAVSLAAGDYFVVCANAGTTINCDLDVSPNTNLIQNGAPDAVAVTFGGAILDTVSYEGDTVPPYTEGSGDGLEDDSGVDFSGISRFPDGVDTDMNNVDLSPRCITPGEENLAADSNCVQPVRSAIVINEIDYDQPSTDTAEFVELKNITAEAVDLDAWTLELVNGSSGAVYQSIDLPAATLAAGDYYVICADAGTVPNCDLDAISSIQNGAPDAAGLMLDGEVVEAVSYEGDTAAPYTEGSGVGLEDPGATGDDNLGISRFPDGVDTEQNNVDLSTRCITPGAPNTSVTDDCLIAAPALEIHEIQGAGLVSPFETMVVNATDNIVTGVTPDGFFIQTPDARVDGDAETSQGVFVFTGVAPTVAIGDSVDVRGEIEEFFDNTEFGSSPLVAVDSGGNPLPAAVVFDELTPSPDQPQPDTEVERFEGMLVAFDGIATAPTNQFGETAVVAKAERTFREPGIEFPGLTGLPVWDGNPEIFEVDADGAGLPNTPIFATQTVTAEGPLGFSFGDYQVLPTSLTLGPVPALPDPVRDREPGEFTIGTQNAERLCDADPAECDPVAGSEQDYQDRLEKFSRQIREVLGAPDIVAMQEVEGLNVLEDLAARILADDAGLAYSAWSLPGNDVGGINVGYLTRDDTIAVSSLEQVGKDTIFDFDGSLLNDRPPLVIEGDYIGGGGSFPLTVINVHQRSLGGIDDPSDGERVRLKRFEQARELSIYIQGRQTADPAEHIAVTGDFNAFQFTDGYVDVLGQITGNLDPDGALVPGTDEVDPDLSNRVLDLAADQRYSFVFAGSAQVLDHMLASVTLDPFVSGIEYGRGDADAPRSFDDDPSTALRSADHDGLVLFIDTDPGFTLFAPAPGVAGEDNSFPAIGATPGGKILLGGGREESATARFVPGCGVLLFDIGPKVNNFGTAFANVKGAGTVTHPIGLPFAGQTAYFQAVDQATCTLSDVVAVEFEAPE